MNKEYKLVEKCYYLPEFFIKDLGYPYYQSDFRIWGKNMNVAKSSFLKSDIAIGLRNNHNEEFTYLNLSLYRDKDYDLYEFEDKTWTLDQIAHVLDYRKKLEEFHALPNKYCYKRKGGYYYRSNNSGYTEYRKHAGIYLKQDCIDSYIRSHGDVIPIPIDIEEHNNMIQKEIDNLKENLIK